MAKVTRDAPKFVPVVITLESQAEVNECHKMLGAHPSSVGGADFLSIYQELSKYVK